MNKHLHRWPVTYAFLTAIIILGLIWQTLAVMNA